MKFFKSSDFVKAAILFFFACAQFQFFSSDARSSDFLKRKIESRIERALADFGLDASIERMGASKEKGVFIEGLVLFKNGRTLLKADTISAGYGSLGDLASAMLFEDLSSSAEIEIDGLEVFLSGEKDGKMFSFPSKDIEKTRGLTDENQSKLPARKIPKIKLNNSAINFAEFRFLVEESDISIVEGDPGNLKVILENGNISLPNEGVSVKNLSLVSDVLTTDGIKIDTISGSAAIETSLGQSRAEFKISVPSDASNTVWKGRLLFSEINFLNRNGEISFASAAFGKDGILSTQGEISLGSLSSNISAKFNMFGGGLIPRLGEKNGFEIETELFSNQWEPVPIFRGLKAVGNIYQKDGLIKAVGKFSQDRGHGFRASKKLTKNSGFEILLKNYKFGSAKLSVKSPEFLIDASLKKSDGRGVEGNYKIKSKDVFNISSLTRILRGYSMSGKASSSGKLERGKNGTVFLSGEAEFEDFSATVRKRIKIDKTQAHFKIPIENFLFENVSVKSSMKNVFYGETPAKKIDFTIGKSSRLKVEFTDGTSLNLSADIVSENKNVRADIKSLKIKADDFEMSLPESFVANISGGNIDIKGLLLSGENSNLQLSGSYERGNSEKLRNLFADFYGINSVLFENFYPSLAKHRGLLSGKIILDGPKQWPVADVNLKYKELSGDANGNLSIARTALSDRFSVNLLFENNSGDFLKVDGELSNAGKNPADIKKVLLDISNYDLNLSAKNSSIKPVRFLSEKIQNLDGVFSGEISVSNKGQAPDIQGEINIDGANIALYPWTELLEMRYAKMVFEKDKVSASFRVRDTFGEAEAKGNFNIGDFSYLFDVGLEGIFLRIKQLHSGFYGKLSIEGAGKNIKIRGENLKTKNANIWIKPNYNIAVGGLTFVDSPNSEAENNFSEGKRTGFFAHTSDLDLSLHISEDTKFKLDKVNSLLTGKLNITRKPGDNFSGIKGDLTVYRGSYTMFGKQFAVDRGSISLSSRAYLSSTVDINALYETKELSVKANLSGETDNLTLRLSSVPEMKEDEIIIALLTSGERSGRESRTLYIVKNISSDRGSGYFAFGYAADELFSSVAQSGSLLNVVDVFSITREGAGIVDSEIEVGTHITDRLYLAYERVSEILPVSASYKSRFTAEYDLNKYFAIEGVAGGLTPGFNLLFNFDFR